MSTKKTAPVVSNSVIKYTKSIRAYSREILSAVLPELAKGDLNDSMASRGGYDYLMETKWIPGWTCSLSVKAEKRFTGNFFVEDWHDKKTSKQGWLHTMQSSVLIYHFLEKDIAYFIPVEKLRKFVIGNMESFQAKTQNKYLQANLTTGFLVPVDQVVENCKAIAVPELSLGKFPRSIARPFREAYRMENQNSFYIDAGQTATER